MASTRADFIWEEPRLGAGSFGEVHRVRRRADGVTYVIKTIGASLSSRARAPECGLALPSTHLFFI